MNNNLGFIGPGNMAQSIIKGLLNTNYTNAENIIAYNTKKEKLKNLKEKLNINITIDIKELANQCNIIFLCVKPNVLESVCRVLSPNITKDTLIVSIAAGVNTKNISNYLNGHKRIIRVMPNLNISVGEGMCMICKNNYSETEDLNIIKEIFDILGKTLILEEKYIDAFTALASSSPAFVFILIEAMADAGVLMGLNRNDSYEIAAQTLLGSAKLVLDGKEIPAALKDKVCSPKGTTIEGVSYLENNNFRGTIIEALRKCEEKCKKL